MGEKWREGRNFCRLVIYSGEVDRNFGFADFLSLRVDVGEEGSGRKKFFSPLLEILEM